jgi:hypothetical protein
MKPRVIHLLAIELSTKLEERGHGHIPTSVFAECIGEFHAQHLDRQAVELRKIHEDMKV